MMKIIATILALTAALASSPAWSHGGNSHGGHGFHGGARFHGGDHGAFHHFHGDHFYGHFGGFVGAPYFWPWYYPPPYYAPAYPYFNPPAYFYDPPPVAPQSSSGYAPPLAVGPDSAEDPVELPPPDTPKQGSSNGTEQAPSNQLFMYPR